MGAELAPASSTCTREDNRAGEAHALQPPPFAGRGAAPDGASGAPFSFFAAGASLAKRYRHQASTTKQGIKTRIRHLLVAARELEEPPAILEAREPAAGISLERLGSRRHV